MGNPNCDPLGFSYLYQGLASVPKCGLASLNSTQAKVMLFALSLLLIGGGIYGAVVAPNVWGSYVVIGVGASCFLLPSYFFIRDAIHRLKHSDHRAHHPLPSQEREQSASESLPFQIGDIRHLCLPDNIPRFSSSEIPEEYKAEGFQRLLDVFEQKKSALILGFDRSGVKTLFLRLTMSNEGHFFQDNIIRLAFEDSKWSVYALKEGFISFNASSTSDSAQTKWLQALLTGESLPCTHFSSESKDSFAYRDLSCELWKPSGK